ncbi:hypothetical protein EI77_04203 [Prosthecobacter fusiformis]|uniref:Uncharacterized protein n=1 Tax=Prosthecobacter fusiformis TaxID=48464 RepID=A0A4R7RKZ2_9BACT|nr:hypothetical protein [Prosthecobacter fusiformis]TDU64315.1 hypothetical protein EI77_04203 [Prosthecobacter fusiformis]
MSQLSPEQLAQVEIWAADGANLNLVQDRLRTEFGITMTYLDARLLMLDVGVRIKDKPREVAKPADPAPAAPLTGEAFPAEDETWNENFDDVSTEQMPSAGITMSADQITIPGALISGKVTFSDGVNASWFLDQMGRLGLSGAPQGYQPPPVDVPQFQQQLDLFLQKAGL